MKQEAPMRLRLWGVRGSTPAPEPENAGYGGNTSCLEIQSGDSTPLVFDAGTGARGLGLAMTQRVPGNGARVAIFLTHFHWDHIQGLPFFAPLYLPSFQVQFHSIHPAGKLQRILEAQMRGPYFPAPEAVQAHLQYLEIPAEGVLVGDLQVKAFPLCHPGGSVAYSVRGPRGLIVYACDHEHGNDAVDRGLRANAEGADVLIYDAQYTPEEYSGRRGWGHSTWLEAVKVARDASVRRLVLFHHDPQHNDEAVSEIVSNASAQFQNTIGAKEGWTISL